MNNLFKALDELEMEDKGVSEARGLCEETERRMAMWKTIEAWKAWKAETSGTFDGLWGQVEKAFGPDEKPTFRDRLMWLVGHLMGRFHEEVGGGEHES